MLFWRYSPHGASRLQLAVLRHEPLQLRRQRAATAAQRAAAQRAAAQRAAAQRAATQRAAADGGGGAAALTVARRAAQQRAWSGFGLGLGFGL